MSEIIIDLKIGVDGAQKKELYKHIDVSFEFHQQKLQKICHELCGALNKNVVPFIVVQMPTAMRNINVFNFVGKMYEMGQHASGNKLYIYANPKQKQSVKLIKNVEKEFMKITRLNNNCSLKWSLYDIGHQNIGLSILNRSKLKGHLSTDPELLSVFIDIVRRISNQFLNSPPMALFQLLEQFSWKAELDKIEEFPEELLKSIAEWLSFREWFHKQRVPELQKVKGEMVIYVTLPKLLNVKLKMDCSTLGSFVSSIG